MNGVPLNIDWQQILLHLLNFVILFAILYFLLYKPVRNFMDKRKAAYQEMDDAANAAKEEAETIKAQCEEQLAGLDEEMAKKRQEAIDAAQQRAKNITDNANKQASEIISKAEKQAEAERDRIIAEAGSTITEMAKEAAEKAIFSDTSEAFDSFLDTAEGKK